MKPLRNRSPTSDSKTTFTAKYFSRKSVAPPIASIARRVSCQIGSFSLRLAPALRIGWVLSPSWLTGALTYELGVSGGTPAVLDQLGLNILDARITPVGNGFSLDSYHVLEDDGSAISDPERLMEIERALWGSLQRPEEAPLAVSRRATRQMRVFRTPTQIAITVDERNRRSVLELTAADRPGLLCDVGKVLWEERVDLHAAKISTLGERAEDVFYLTDRAQRPLDEAAAERLRAHLSQALDRRLA